METYIELENLKGIKGVPNTKQGLRKKAISENWRRRRVQGKKGNVFEYCVNDMPAEVQQALGFTPELETRKETLNLMPNRKGDELMAIPFYNAFTSAGFGVLNETDCTPDDFIGLSSQWLWHKGLYKDNLLFILACGDSMEPTIRNNDMLLINRSATVPRDGKIYVLRLGEQLLVKRVQSLVNGMRLISDNLELYQPIDVLYNDEFNAEVLGQVVFIGHSLI